MTFTKGSSIASSSNNLGSQETVKVGSQTCLSGSKAGLETTKHLSFSAKIFNGLKSIWSTRQTQDTKADVDLHIKTTLRELIIYMIFLAILCILTFGMANPVTYYFTNIMSGLFTESGDTTFNDIGSMGDFWDVMEGPIIDGIYWEKWYNDDNVSQDLVGSIYFENKVLGLPRLRQVRVKKNSCTVHPKFKNGIANCYDTYGSGSEDQSPFGIYAEDQSNMNDTAFYYQSSSKIKGTGYEGKISTYGGGGYVKNLAHTKDEATEILEFLKSNLWLDRGTRAVFLDFTVYNANINLFCQIKLIVEFPATGGAMTSSVFRTVKLIRYVSSMDYFVLACEVIFIFFILYYSVEEALEIKIHKLKYFTENIWNILDVVVILISYICIVFNIYRMIKVDQVLSSLLTDLDQFVDFEFLCFWQTQFNNAIALTVFLSWIKIFKYISFNKTMNQLSSTLGRCAKDIAGFSVMFYIVFFAYAQLGYLLFGSVLEDYSTFVTALFTLFRVILGDFDFPSLESASKIMGPLYFISYVFFVFFVLLNMFLAIINDTYTEVKEDLGSQENEFELGAYFKRGYDKMLDKLNLKKDKIVDIQKTILTADKDNDKKLDFDEWRNELRTRGYSDIEIEALFAQYDLDGDRVLSESEQKVIEKQLEKESQELDEEANKIKEAKAAIEEEEHEEQNRKANIVSPQEFNILTKRVDTMEYSIGNIVSRIDTVLSKLETIEKAKLKRREAMTKILDTINNTSDMNDEAKKQHLESLIQEELRHWDEPGIGNNNNKDSRTSSASKKAPF